MSQDFICGFGAGIAFTIAALLFLARGGRRAPIGERPGAKPPPPPAPPAARR